MTKYDYLIKTHPLSVFTSAPSRVLTVLKKNVKIYACGHRARSSKESRGLEIFGIWNLESDCYY